MELKGAQSLFDLVQAFAHTSFQSRNVYKCFEVYRKMLRDPTCVIFLGLSGAMIEKKSTYAAVYMDATIALPMLVGAILQEGKVYRKRKRRCFIWEGDRLRSIRFV